MTVEEATVEKLRADAKNLRALARKNLAEAKIIEIELAEVNQMYEESQASDWNNRVYRFVDKVEPATALACIDALTTWSRLDDEPGGMEIVFNSPGGSVYHGLALYDTIRMLSRKGHHITTTALGQAASMAGILLQAGDTRQIGAEAILHIHDMGWGIDHARLHVHGDEVQGAQAQQERIWQIFINRSKLSKEKFMKIIHDGRGECHFTSDDCIMHGFADVIV